MNSAENKNIFHLSSHSLMFITRSIVCLSRYHLAVPHEMYANRWQFNKTSSIRARRELVRSCSIKPVSSTHRRIYKQETTRMFANDVFPANFTEIKRKVCQLKPHNHKRAHMKNTLFTLLRLL